MLLTALMLWFIATGVLLFLYGWREMISAWREPVLSRPILIIESDDWGAGPVGQASALREIADILLGFTDCDGRRPVMTLGMILATADGEKTLSSGRYHRQVISVQTHTQLLGAIGKGVEERVFSVQLHGMEHFWPAALMAASGQDGAINDWLAHSPEFQTEELPAPLQSRWVDASVLPARRLSIAAVNQAAQDEVRAFENVFGILPSVVVPPTFVWSKDVESAWAKAGISVIVTPGCRYETRDEAGRPAARGGAIYNGQSCDNGLVYLVRDTYFEPVLGHTAHQALDAVLSKTRLGRPTLFETHRFNFLGSDEKRQHALDELGGLLRMSLARLPDLAFISSEKLAMIFRSRDPEWLEQRFRRRLHVWINRLGELPRLRKLAWLTGWIVPAVL
ncbi:MAG: glycosyl hydrolase, partial [Gammaproteobacteria bacterium]